jgi:hypothetical protein
MLQIIMLSIRCTFPYYIFSKSTIGFVGHTMGSTNQRPSQKKLWVRANRDNKLKCFFFFPQRFEMKNKIP